MNWLDLFFIAVLLLSAVGGFKRGLIKGAGGILSLVAAIWAAVSFYEPLGVFISEKWNTGERIANFLSERMEGEQGAGGVNLELVPENYLQSGLNTVQFTADTILNVVSFLLILAITYMAAKLLVNLLALAVNKTIIFMPLDKIGGIVFGLARGVIVVGLIIIIIISLQAPFSFIFNAGDGTVFLYSALKNSEIATCMLQFIDNFNLPVKPNLFVSI